MSSVAQGRVDDLLSSPTMQSVLLYCAMPTGTYHAWIVAVVNNDPVNPFHFHLTVHDFIYSYQSTGNYVKRKRKKERTKESTVQYSTVQLGSKKGTAIYNRTRKSKETKTWTL